MAIRTLGEAKAADAIPTLQALLTSKEPFVAEYAARTPAEIQKRPLPAIPRQPISDDLKILPPDTGIVGHFSGTTGSVLTLERITEFAPPRYPEKPRRAGAGATARPRPRSTRNKYLR